MFTKILIKQTRVYYKISSLLGGNDVSISEALYQLNYADKCGAVLVHKKWALTTAHCGDGTFLRVGSRHRLKGRKIQINSRFIHPSYQLHHEFDYDIQLLRLFRALQFEERIAAIKICSDNCGGHLRVFGWGYAEEKGDSGGAAISSGQLVGLCSFGYGCGRGVPGVYANLSHEAVRSWVYSHTGA